MDTTKLVERAKNILTTPRTEWAAIGAEGVTAGSVPDLYKNYIAILAALPALALFVKGSVIGYGALGITVRNSIGAGLASMVLHYLLSLALAYAMALIVSALAPTFGGQKDTAQALRVVAYAWTASWVAAIGTILPWLGALIALAGGIYSLYLFYLGLPHTMKCPPARAAAYAAVSIVIAIALSWMVGLTVAGIAGTGAVLSGPR